MAQALFIAFITQICITLSGMLGLSLWVVNASDVDRRGPEWSKRLRFFNCFGFAMAFLMLMTVIIAITLKVNSI